MRTARFAVLGIALAMGSSACSPAFRSPPPTRSSEWTRPQPIRLPALARVRLTLADSQRVVVGASGSADLVLERRGALVQASDGRVATRLELGGLASSSTIEGRRYPGRLLVEPGAAGGVEVVDELPLEQYVEGVVASELAIWSALPAEREAQAIVARTYATRVLALAGVLADTTQDQCFRGAFVPGDGRAAQEVARKLSAAVRATRGVVLAREGHLLDARFHAACGGGTAELAAVFPRGGRACPGVACEPCLDRAQDELTQGTPDPARPLGWRHAAGRADLDALAEELQVGQQVLELVASRRDPAGRWLEVEVRGTGGRRTISLAELRELLGEKALKSGRILHVRPAGAGPSDRGLVFDGLGRGHGVGLCQEGAHDYAQRGWSAEAILAHYYPGASLHPADSAAP